MPKKKQRHDRVSVRNAKEAIFRPNPSNIRQDGFNRDFAKEVDREVYVYTVRGQQDYFDLDDNPVLDDLDEYGDCEYRNEGFAKKVIIDEGDPIYYIKVGDNGRFYNPFGLFDEGRHNKFRRNAGRYEFEYREVNIEAFQSYLNFLKTKNKAYLTRAEREAF